MSAQLTPTEKQQFVSDGYLTLPGAVAGTFVNAALRSINASLGADGLDPGLLATFRAQSYCPALQSSPAILDLLNASGLLFQAESLIGVGKVAPVRSGQIALRFPSLDPLPPVHPHLDGMYTPTNGVPKGTIRNFTLLVGVVLSNVPERDSGNLVVWPGSHVQYEQYFREHGPAALLEGMPPVTLSQPVQVTATPGDAVLCHYQLGHGIAGNASPHVRYAVYFRLKHLQHDTAPWECMTDIWREWEGIRGATGSVRQGDPAGLASRTSPKPLYYQFQAEQPGQGPLRVLGGGLRRLAPPNRGEGTAEAGEDPEAVLQALRGALQNWTDGAPNPAARPSGARERRPGAAPVFGTPGS